MGVTDWTEKPVGELMKIETGSRNTEDKIDDGQYPFFVRSQTVECIDDYHYDCEAVLTAGDGVGTGKVFHYINGKFDAHQRVYVMSQFKDVVGKYFYYWFSKNFYNEVTKYTAKTSVDSVRRQMIAGMMIPVPPISEQVKIVNTLSDIDTLIVDLQKLIRKKKDIRQGTMQMLVTGKKRLKGFTKEWGKASFENTFSLYSNNTFSRNMLNDSSGKYLDVHYGDVLIKFPDVLDCNLEQLPFINDDVEISASTFQLKDGDIIIADTAEDETVGKTTEIINVGNKLILAGLHTIFCRPKQDIFSPMWLGYYMNSKYYHDQFLPYITGIKVSSIAKSAIKETEILIPEKSEQEAITSILCDMDSGIYKLEEKLYKYQEIKQGMMEELLTGKVRLS